MVECLYYSLDNLLRNTLNMTQEIKILDVVALLKAIPVHQLRPGQVGTVVEMIGENNFEVEFVDKQGRTIAMLPLKRTDFLVLQFEMKTS